MEDNNLLDYNQHQLMKRSPTLITGPSMVFLAPAKKGFRIPILKCKILLASNHMALLHNQPLLITLLVNLLITANHLYYCSFTHQPCYQHYSNTLYWSLCHWSCLGCRCHWVLHLLSWIVHSMSVEDHNHVYHKVYLSLFTAQNVYLPLYVSLLYMYFSHSWLNSSIM